MALFSTADSWWVSLHLWTELSYRPAPIPWAAPRCPWVQLLLGKLTKLPIVCIAFNGYPMNCSTSGIEYANFPKRDLIFCLTSVESYLDLSAQDLEFGFNETRRDRILRTFVRNNFHYHLNEIFAVLKVRITRTLLLRINIRLQCFKTFVNCIFYFVTSIFNHRCFRMSTLTGKKPYVIP